MAASRPVEQASACREAFIKAPDRIPFYLRLGIWFAEREAGQAMLPARLLAWYPRAAISSGVLEALIADGKTDLNPRLLRLVRLQTSLAAACPFCVQMNSTAMEDSRLTPEELSALQGRIELSTVTTFTQRERLAIEYARLISRSPLSFPPEFVEALTASFTEREIVILATTAAQVNYWTRLFQALGIPAPEASDQCDVPAPGAPQN